MIEANEDLFLAVKVVTRKLITEDLSVLLIYVTFQYSTL
jgi:hypothetical protein